MPPFLRCSESIIKGKFEIITDSHCYSEFSINCAIWIPTNCASSVFVIQSQFSLVGEAPPIPLNISCGDGCAFLRTRKKSDTSYPVSLQYRYGLVLLIPYYFDASSHSVDVSSPGTSIARCENQLSSAAPCQCFTPAGMFTQSPGFIATGSLPHS